MRDQEAETALGGAPTTDPFRLWRDLLRRREVLGPALVVALAVLLVGFVAGRSTAPDDEGAVDAGRPSVAFPAGDEDRVGYWGFGGVTPVVVDAFDRSDSSGLGAPETGPPWSVLAGEWSVQANRAAVAAGPGVAIAVVDGGPADRLTEATLMAVEDGAGIAFRVVDGRNHWSLTVTPERTSWVLARVQGGRTEVVDEIAGPVAATTTVGVAVRGDLVRVLFDGREAARLRDPVHQGATGSGLVAGRGRQGAARWDRFFVGALPA